MIPAPGGSNSGSGNANADGGDSEADGGDAPITVSVGFVAEAVVAQADGKLLVAGRQGDLAGGSSRAVFKRLNPDGSLDTSFGDGGTVVTPAGNNDAFYALALVDGGIVAAGTRGGDVLVAATTRPGAA